MYSCRSETVTYFCWFLLMVVCLCARDFFFFLFNVDLMVIGMFLWELFEAWIKVYFHRGL